MILTFKQKHKSDYTDALLKAKSIAEYAVDHKKEKLSSKNVSQFGLPSAISNQILRKYGKNKKIKKVSSIKLIIPNQAIKLNKEKQEIEITCLKLKFNYNIQLPFNKINQIEIGNEYYYISVEVNELPEYESTDYLGVDLNTTGHCAVVACKATNKIIKLGKKAKHVHTKYAKIRKKLQKAKKYNALKKLKKRESNIVRDLNHKISRKIVDYAYEHQLGIKLEDLSEIRKTAKNNKKNKDWIYSLNSWSYYQLGQMITYKSKLLGVPVVFVNPAYTSKTCSRCGCIGNRNGKKFKCQHCGHTSHADINAAFNISKWEVDGISPNGTMEADKSGLLPSYDNRMEIPQSYKEDDLYESSTDKLEVAMYSNNATTNPSPIRA
jgi:putative transposase